MFTDSFSEISSLMIKGFLLGLLNVYRWTRPYQHVILPPTCRFYPTCSAYAEQSIRENGLMTGLWLSLKRLLRCHPGQPGGIDFVPTSLNQPVR